MTHAPQPTDRLPPHSVEAEQCLLGALLQGAPIDEVSTQVTADIFYDIRHRAIFGSITQLHDAQFPVDATSLMEHLKSKGQLDACGGLAYIASLPDLSPSAFNWPYWAGVLIDFHTRRRAIQAGIAIIESAYDENGPGTERLLEAVESGLHTFTVRNPQDEYSAKSAVLAMTNDLERRYDLHGKRSGVVTGFGRLDAMLDGIQYGELTVMGARPSHGKSAFGLNVLHCAVFYQEIPSLFVTLEMSVPALMRRLLSSSHSIPLKTLKTGQLAEHEFACAAQFNAAASHKPMHFLDAIRGMKASDLSRKIRFYCRERAVKLVIVDYLQKVKPDTKHEKRTYEVASVSESLKACAVDTGAAFFVLAQMSREPDKDKSKGPPRGPRLSDLADSAQIERDADTVLLLQRAMPTNKASIYVAKQRDGELGVIDYTFEGQYVRFIENHETP
jgi:replicative DNA helicase